MKTLLLGCRLGMWIAVFILNGVAFAQCGWGTMNQKQCNGTVDGSVCTSVIPAPDPNLYCSTGYGACPPGIEGNFTTTNWSCDDSCGPASGGGAGCGGGGGGCTTCGPCPPQFQKTSVGVHPDCSPIIVDTTGHGFDLTSANDGVMFDIAGDGHAIKLAWTARNSGNAFLALPHNGRITNGKELFGNFTAQPPCPDGGSSCLNGYRALAEFDKLENGGNGDGIIDARDAVFSHLLLWIDENHDGISQPNELHSLPELGVYSISLRYRDDRHFYDQYGNWFHYQAALNPDTADGESKDGRVTYDVFFEVANQAIEPASSAQSHAFGRRGQSHISFAAGNYWDAALTDGFALSLSNGDREERSHDVLSNTSDILGGGTMKLSALALAGACAMSPALCAQQVSTAPPLTLKATARGEIPLTSPKAAAMLGAARCDDAGNIYARLFDWSNSQEQHHAPIQEFSPDARLAGSFRVEDAFPGEAGGMAFFVDHEGRIYELLLHRGIYDVVEFSHGGSVRARARLELDGRSSQVQPYHLAVFKSGEYLVAGTTSTDKDGKFPEGWASSGDKALRHTPYAAVFAADGRLVKRIYEPEDEEARRKADGGDTGYTSLLTNAGNKFVELGDVAAGSDGNVYLLHGGPAPVVYVISPAGDVIRKLPVSVGDASDPDHIAQGSIKSYAGRLAIGFNGSIRIIDQKGGPIASYEVGTGGEGTGLSLACYGSGGLAMIGYANGYATNKLPLLAVRLP